MSGTLVAHGTDFGSPTFTADHNWTHLEGRYNYEGIHKVITKPDGTWEVNYEGKYEYVGGTGRFKNIKGHGSYRGHITPDGLTEEDEAEVSY